MEPIKSYVTREGWKRDWRQTKSHAQSFARLLYDALSGNQEQQENQLLIDRDRVILLRPDRIVDYRLDLGMVFVLVPESRPSIRPDLAHPHIYSTRESESLETRIKSVNSIYQ